MARPTAALVRSTLRADAKVLATLSPAARKTVEAGARGSLHPEAKAAFNAGRRGVHRYTEGNTKKVVAETAAHREALRAKGVQVGKRGPLSKAARKVKVAKTKA